MLKAMPWLRKAGAGHAARFSIGRYRFSRAWCLGPIRRFSRPCSLRKVRSRFFSV